MTKHTEKKLGDPIHPGELLSDELDYIGMKASQLAVHIGVPKNRIYEIVNEERGMTADTAIRLGVFFGTGPNLWLNHQKSYELDVAKQKIGDGLKYIKPYHVSLAKPGLAL